MLSFKLYLNLTCGCAAGTLGVLAGDGLGTGGLVIGTLALMDFMLELELSLLPAETITVSSVGRVRSLEMKYFSKLLAIITMSSPGLL